MVRVPTIELNLDELNHSELVALAKWCGLRASRAIPRKMLVEALQNFEDIDAPEAFNQLRHKVSKWLERHWAQVQMQVKRKACPNCYLCRDAQVLSCYLENKRWIAGK